MKLYLAGPMRGKPDMNFPAFDATADALRAKGHEVFNPTSLGNDATKPLAWYMATDLAEVCKADAIAMLPGWRESAGASLEYHVASVVGVPAVDADTLKPISETILDEAERITSCDRNAHYGHPKDDFAAIAGGWAAYLTKRLGAQITLDGRDVAWLMVLVKAMRDANTRKRDNLVDGAGYLRCAERLDE